MKFETHQGVTLQRVRVRRDVYTVDGRLKVEAGAVGLIASRRQDGQCGVTFEYHDNAQFILPDGSGRKSQYIEFCNLDTE